MPGGAGEAANVSWPAGTESHTKSHKDSLNEPRYAGLISLSPGTLPVLETELRHPAGLQKATSAHALSIRARSEHRRSPAHPGASGRTAQARLGGTRGSTSSGVDKGGRAHALT